MSQPTSPSLHSLEQSGAEFVFNSTTGTLEWIIDIDAEYDEDNIPSGTVTIESYTDREEQTIDAGEFDFDLVDGERYVVPLHAVTNAEQVLIEFAQQELKNYLSRLGGDHPFNGVPHVQTVRDLVAASLAYRADHDQATQSPQIDTSPADD